MTGSGSLFWFWINGRSCSSSRHTLVGQILTGCIVTVLLMTMFILQPAFTQKSLSSAPGSRRDYPEFLSSCRRSSLAGSLNTDARV
jgi:hypothetical protein